MEAAPAPNGPLEFVRPVNTSTWPPLLRHAKAGNLEEVGKTLDDGADPNATAAPDDDRTPLFEGHHLVVLAKAIGKGGVPGARELAKKACQGLRDVPPHPTSPLEAARNFMLGHILEVASQVLLGYDENPGARSPRSQCRP